MEKIAVVRGDDWEGLYINGILVYENHSIDLYTFAEKVKIYIDFIEADSDWLESRGNLPRNLKDVKEST